jgi:hypothetical protein
VVYIAGNQSTITYWQSFVRLKKTSDYEREITLALHFPVQFKFTGGNWDRETIVTGHQKRTEAGWEPLLVKEPKSRIVYEITAWKNKLDY